MIKMLEDQKGRGEETEWVDRKRDLEQFIVEVIEFETPIRQCFCFYNQIWTSNVAVSNSMNLLTYISLYAILNKLNLLALIYWFIMWFVFRNNFRPNIFVKSNSQLQQRSPNVGDSYNIKSQFDSTKNRNLRIFLRILISFISLMIVLQLSASVYTNIQSTSQEQLAKNMFNQFCPIPSKPPDEDEYDEDGNIYQNAQSIQSPEQINKECARDWSYYLLAIPAVSQTDEESQQNLAENIEAVNQSVVLDFVFLLVAYLQYFVSSGLIRLTEKQKMELPRINDEHDFVTTEEKSKNQLRSQSWRIIQTTFFIYLPYLLIFYLMYASASLNWRAMADLVSSIYLWFALKFTINIKKLFSKNNKLLGPLRTYNRFVLTLILIYQMPLFLCPSAVDINGFTDPDYITTEDCSLIMRQHSYSSMKKQYEAKQPMQLYIILSQSIGVQKENYVNMTFLFLFLLTEIQSQMFKHPHYREYVVKHMIIDKESDGKLRAFMFVERFHLQRLWAYRAIKEEIKILHKILVRLNEQISKSDFAKNLVGFVEYQQKHNLQNQEVVAGEQQRMIQNEEIKEPADDQIPSLPSGVGESSLSKEVRMFIESNSNVIDQVALRNLDPKKVVIPLKRITESLEMQLENDVRGGKRLEDFDEESLTEYVKQFLKKIEDWVVTKNRVGLYNKEGLGLMLALEASNLDEEMQESLYLHPKRSDGDSKTSQTKPQQILPLGETKINRQALYRRFYVPLSEVAKNLPNSSSNQSSAEQASDFIKDQSKMVRFEPQSDDASSLRSKGSNSEDFNPSPLAYNISETEEQETTKDMTWSQRVNYQVRLYLWRNHVDFILLMYMEKSKDQVFRLKRPRLEDYGFWRLVEASILSRSHSILVLAVIFNFFMSANFISLFIFLAVFCYSILENPIPSTRFWKFMMSYVLTVISLKFLYQLPIFCGTPVYTVYSDKCNNEELIPQALASRIDYLIGIHKFSGPTSYPRNQGIFFGILPDVLLLIVMLLHKQFLSKIGAWNYVKIQRNIYQNPSFSMDKKDSNSESSDSLNSRQSQQRNPEVRSQISDQRSIQSVRTQPFLVRIWNSLVDSVMNVAYFYLKILPQYLNRKQENLDRRRKKDEPMITHKFQKVKPGKDYFTQIFFTLLVIIIYTLIYWRNISGEDKAQSFGAATVSLDRFSTIQVITLFLILLLLLIERMLYRARYIDQRDNLGKYQSQPRAAGPETGINNIQQFYQQRARKSSGSKHALLIKLILYYTLVIVIHICLGFVVPIYQLAPMFYNPWLVVYYLIWALYFYFSAQQIRHGYPMAPYKQAFQDNTNIVSYIAWKTYKAIPFIWEMKVIIDWTVTTTCLDLYQWFKLDDAYNTLYYNKVQSDQRKERAEFQQRKLWEKVLQGFCFAFGLILVILAPILLFSGINPIMVKNPVKAGTLSIELELIATGNSYKIFETQATKISSLTQTDDTSWRLYFEPVSSQIDYNDMQKLHFNTYSDNQWTISPPSLKRFINDFKTVSKDKSKESEVVNFVAQWTLLRDNPTGKEKAVGKRVVALTKNDFLPVIQILERDSYIKYSNPKRQQSLAQIEDEQLAQLQEDIVYDYRPPLMMDMLSQINNPYLPLQNYIPQPMSPYLGFDYFGMQPQIEGIDENGYVLPMGIFPEPRQMSDSELAKEEDRRLSQYFPTSRYPSYHYLNVPLNRPERIQKQANQNYSNQSSTFQNQRQRIKNQKTDGLSKTITPNSTYSKPSEKTANLTLYLNSSIIRNNNQNVSKPIIKTNTSKPFSNVNQTMTNSTNNTLRLDKSEKNQSKQDQIVANKSATIAPQPRNENQVNDTDRGDDSDDLREIEQSLSNQLKGPKVIREFKHGKALISVLDAFPKLIHLNAQANADNLNVNQLQSNTSIFTSVELLINRIGVGAQIYYWTFSLGSSDGRKNNTAYLRDTPGVFNSRNSQEDIDQESKAEKRKQGTSKVDKKLREKDKAEMARKKVQDEQNLVILVYNEEVIGTFFGNALQLSVVGLYATIVIAIGRFIRIIFDRISQRVMYEELPNTRQLFEICEGIFIAQQEGDLVREKQLYDLLILMYRSPEALIKLTGTRLNHKEIDSDEEQERLLSEETLSSNPSQRQQSSRE